jgi:hypothetical protein
MIEERTRLEFVLAVSKQNEVRSCIRIHAYVAASFLETDFVICCIYFRTMFVAEPGSLKNPVVQLIVG